MTREKHTTTRRNFLKTAAAVSLPALVPCRAFGANDRITMGCIGTGGRGTGDMRGFMNFDELRVLAVCDVVGKHCNRAKQYVDKKYGNANCAAYVDFRKIMERDDIDTVMIGTPDHWHAPLGITAMRCGKDVFSEKPETLTIGEGRKMVETARRLGRIFSGGSQRVWGDCHQLHKIVRGGVIGEVTEAWVDCWGPSGPCGLEPVPTPDDVNWDLWLGPAPVRPYHPKLIKGGFRPYRDYSGGGMTDWGAHNFGGALFSLNLHHEGPVKIIPPGAEDNKYLTFVFKNGVQVHHKGADGRMTFTGTAGTYSWNDMRKRKIDPPDIYIPNYKGRGILGDFLACVRSRELPFRDIEVAHRTVSVCHLGNICYWLNRTLKWDPDTEDFIGDPEASRWVDRSKREPWAQYF